MGFFETYCSFCAGPLEDGREAWLWYLQSGKGSAWPPKDGEWVNLPGYPVPTAPIDEIVTISPEDGQTWADWVCVGSTWPGYVSPPCTAGDYGTVEIDVSSEWMHGAARFIRIHRVCLSFLCRRVAITPEEYWTTLYGSGSDYAKYGDEGKGLLYCLNYVDMVGRTGQSFGYAVERQTPHGDNPEIVDRWDDPNSMEDTAWILSRPTVLLSPQPLGPISIKASGAQSKAPCMQVFDVPVLFDAILEAIVEVDPEIVAKELKLPSEDIDAPSVIAALTRLSHLTQVDRWFYQAIIRDRQSLFLRLAQLLGWMLPCTPADWESWSGSSPIVAGDFDWRAYIQDCLKKDDRHLRNRYRFHSMAVQIARGRAGYNKAGEVTWQWNAGRLGIQSALEKPTPYEWEIVRST